MSITAMTFLRRALAVEGAAICLALAATGCAHSGESAEAPKQAATPTPAAQTQMVATSYEKDIQPMLEKYCYQCHGGDKRSGGVALGTFKTEADVKANARRWNQVKNEIAEKGMPPRQAPNQPTDAERKEITDWITKTLAG